MLDEFGSTAGIVTLEDVLESIVGNIQDEYDNEEEEIKQIILSLPDKSIGAVMKTFKTEYAGKVEMRKVQDVLKNM